jgi:hypothetical protein
MKNIYLTFILSTILTIVLTGSITCAFWQHACVLHHAAFYEADSWGFSHYQWNDTASAQTPFQDEGWQKIQNHLLEKLGNK